MIRALHHVQLAMPPGRESEAVDFYQGLLGIPEREKPAHLAVRGGCWFEDDHVKIHLGAEEGFRPARKAHPGLLVDDLTSLLSRLSEAGFEPVTDEPLPGFHRCYVDDPFGNRVELLEELD